MTIPMIGEMLIIMQAMTFALMNVVDSHIVKKHVSRVPSFIPVAGIANILIALPILIFFWQANTDILLPVIAGICYAGQAYIYYLIIEKEDVSHLIGIVYMYPLLGLVIGKIFFHDELTLINYIGCIVTLIGVVLTLQRTKARWRLLFPLVMIALFVSVEEALQKGAAAQLNPYFSASIQTFVMGVGLLLCLMCRDARKHVGFEFKNLKYAFISEGLSLLAIVFLVLGYKYVSYTAASFISVSQIIFVALIERAWSSYHPEIMHDTQMVNKSIALIVITIGLILVMM